jgi:hypothetical protein
MLKPLALSLFLVHAAAVGQSAPQGQPASPEGREIVVKGELPDAKKRVCKSSVATGSILSKKVCRTKEEWEYIRERSIASAERMKAEARARDHVQATRDNQ